MKKSFLSLLTAGLLVLTPTVALATTAEPTPVQCEDTSTLTILATTDLHGTVLNYDYFTGTSFTDANEDQRNRTRGLELLAPAIDKIREEKGTESVALFDNGDANQGNPLETVYHADRTPTSVDPMATAFNYLNYDAGVVGNHEFNYGITPRGELPGDLQQYEANLDMPLLGANVIERATDKPFLKPYTMVKKIVDGEEVNIGVIGVVTPGIRIWDSAKVTELKFQDTVEAVQQWVPIVKENGADVVVVLAHTGMDAPDYTWDPADLNENLLRSIATQTAGVDVIIGGHSHAINNFDTVLTNSAGEQVLVSQPGYHARFLSEVEVPLVFTDGEVDVVNNADCRPTGTPHYASEYIGQEDAGLRAAIGPWHTNTVKWVATVVAYATEDMLAATAPWEDTPIVDFISLVQTEAVEAGLVGTEYENIPVIAQASPFSRSAIFPEGEVTIANMAGLYTYDNTLKGVHLTGAQVKDYLEWSARYYKQQDEGATIEDWATTTNEVYSGRSIPDYAYDVLSGVHYHIDISKPVGERIENLSHPDGTPVADDDEFIMAINDYRQGGGQSYPHVADATIVFDELQSIRDLMIDWAQANETIDPKDIFTLNWAVGTSTAPAPGLPDVEEPTDPTDPTDPTQCTVMDRPTRLSAATNRFGEATGDVYADVWAVNSDGEMHFYRGGSGGISHRGIVDCDIEVTSLTKVTDLNGDNRADFLASHADGRLFAYYSTGDGFLRQGAQVGHGWNSMDNIVYAGELGSSSTEYVVARQVSTGDLYRYELTSSGLSRTTKIGHGWGGMDYILSVGNIVGSGNSDLVGIRADGKMFAYTGKDNATVTTHGQIGHGWGSFVNVFVPGDLTNDGRMDLVGVRGDGKMFRYANTGRGHFKSALQIGHGWEAMDLIS